MIQLPKPYFFEGFYIWFDKEKKIEYHSTPLYFYYANRRNATIENETVVYLEKDISKVNPSKKPSNEILKHPATFLFPYKERFGNMLVRFLNTNFSSFEASYNYFFYTYGYELLKNNAPHYTLEGRYSSEYELEQVLKTTWKNSKDILLNLQEEYRKFVDYLYNLNGNEEMKSYSISSKFITYMIKHEGSICDYAYNIDVFRHNYADKQSEYGKLGVREMLEKLDNGTLSVPISNIYTSAKLGNILYIVLDELVKTENCPIKVCQNCGKYFIPTTRNDEIYCDFPDVNGLSCREQGAGKTYRKNINEIPALLEYRRSYQKKTMFISRNRENRQLKKDFDKWRKDAQAKIKEYKKGKLSEDKLYDWMMENK